MTPAEGTGWRLFRIGGIVAALGLGTLVMLDRQLPQWLADSPPAADGVLIEKGQRRLHLLRRGRSYRDFGVALGSDPIGPKRRTGDGRTPEGRYRVARRDARSYQYKALYLSYPERRDLLFSAAHGDIPGRAIVIHGQPNGLGWLGWLTQRRDWTNGSIAVGNRAMESIWRAVADGTPVEIVP